MSNYLYNSLWDAWRAHLCPCVNQALLWIAVAINRKCYTILGGSLPYRILTNSVTRFMDYTEKPYMVLCESTFYYRQIWLKIGFARQFPLKAFHV
jgi:hypothetical protein